MGECFITRRGGGSGKLFAAIGVTYPVGSAVTCTNGTKTLTAKTTSGQWVFAIPEAGTWTVTATDGTSSKSESVSITKEGQWESVELSYRYYLFKEGSGAQNGFTFNAVDTGLFSVSASKIVFSDNNALYNSVWATPTLNLSKYSTLKFELQCGNRWDSDRYVTVGVGRNAPSGSSGNVNPGDWTAKTGNIYETTRAVYSVDVSTLTSALYVKLYADAITGEVYNIWLE